MKAYLAAFLANRVGGRDLLELLGKQLRNWVMMLELVDQFAPTLSPDDPTYSVRMAGLERMRSGLAGVVAGTFTSLAEKAIYSTEDRAALLQHSRETLPKMVPKLSPASQSEVLYRLDELASDPEMSDLQPAISELRDEVRAAVRAE